MTGIEAEAPTKITEDLTEWNQRTATKEAPAAEAETAKADLLEELTGIPKGETKLTEDLSEWDRRTQEEEKAEAVTVGKATTIRHPYRGETPVNVENVRKTVPTISDDAIKEAKANMAEYESRKGQTGTTATLKRALENNSSEKNNSFSENSKNWRQNVTKKKAAEIDEAVTMGERRGNKVIVTTEIPGEGMHDTDGTIYLNPNAEHPVRQVLVHEFTHDIETSKIYSRFSKAVLDIAEKIDGANLNQMKEQIRLDEPGLDEPGVERELVARIAGSRLFTDQNMVNRLFDTDQTAFRKIKNWISDALTKVFGSEERKELLQAEKLYLRAMNSRGQVDGYGKEQNSIQNIVSDSGKNYGIGVYLDSDLLTGLSDDGRKEEVKKFVKTKLAGKKLIAFDKKGNPVNFIVAENKKFWNRSGKERPANYDLATKDNDNIVKQEAIVLIDELTLTADERKPKNAEYPHGWLDNYGKNKWGYWTTYIQDKNNAVYKATLNIANDINGRKILYDIDPIKKVAEGAVNLPTTTTTINSISNSAGNVNTKNSGNFKGSSYEDMLEAQNRRTDGRTENEDIRYQSRDYDHVQTSEQNEDSYSYIGYDVYDGNNVVASYSINITDGDDYLIVDRIDVADGMQGKGIGSKILAEICDRYPYKDVYVAPDNEDAKRLYERIGYEVTSGRDYETLLYDDQGYGIYAIDKNKALEFSERKSNKTVNRQYHSSSMPSDIDILNEKNEDIRNFKGSSYEDMLAAQREKLYIRAMNSRGQVDGVGEGQNFIGTKDKKITASMTDSERAAILREKTIPLIEYEGQADEQIEANKESLESRKKTIVSEALKKIKEYFGVPETIENDDFKMIVTTTSRIFDESINKEINDPKHLAKIIPILEDVVKKSVGLETHQNRYFSDSNTVLFHNLIGGYTENNNFIPVRFGVKEARSGGNYLYVIIDDEKIKMTDFTAEATTQKGGRHSTDSVSLNIADILSKVNSPEIIKYVPDDFLNESQRKAKYEAIADTVKKTNDKNDRKYAEFISKRNFAAAQSMVEAAAKNAFANTKIVDEDGELLKVYHGTYDDFTVFDPSKGRSNADIQGMFFSPWELDAAGYGPNVGAYYLNITNPASEATGYRALNAHKGENNAGAKARQDLIAMGYDGVNNGNEEYIAFYPEQIKSADTITYDDDGNVVPISQRFDFEKKDYRNFKGSSYEDMLEAQREKLQKNGAKTGVTMTVDDWVGMAKIHFRLFSTICII